MSGASNPASRASGESADNEAEAVHLWRTGAMGMYGPIEGCQISCVNCGGTLGIAARRISVLKPSDRYPYLALITHAQPSAYAMEITDVETARLFLSAPTHEDLSHCSLRMAVAKKPETSSAQRERPRSVGVRAAEFGQQ